MAIREVNTVYQLFEQDRFEQEDISWFHPYQPVTSSFSFA